MTSIKTLEFDNFSIEAHVRFAEDQEINRASTLPKHPNIGLSISGSLSTSFSPKLDSLFFFDKKNFSWSGFGQAPQTSTSIAYFFSHAFFSDLQSAANRFAIFLKEEHPVQDREVSALISFFKEIETLRGTSALIDSQIKRFHKG